MKASTKIATSTLVGLTLLGGAAGVAGAAQSASTTTGGHHSATRTPGARLRHAERIHAIAVAGVLPASFSCARAATATARIDAAETKIDARVSYAQTAEQRALSNNNSARAARIATRITRADQLKSDLVTVAGLITAKCG